MCLSGHKPDEVQELGGQVPQIAKPAFRIVQSQGIDRLHLETTDAAILRIRAAKGRPFHDQALYVCWHWNPIDSA